MEQWFHLLVVMHGIGVTAGNFYYGPSDVETVLTSKGLTYVGKVIADRVVNKSVAGEVAFGGPFKFQSKTTGWTAQVSGLRVHDIEVPPPDFEISQSDGLTFKTEEMSFKVDFNYSEFTHATIPGRYSVHAHDIEIKLSFQLNPDKLLMNGVTCYATINDLRLVSGDRFLFSIFAANVLESLEDGICEEAKKMMDFTHIISVLSMLDLRNQNTRGLVLESQFKLRNETIYSYHNLTGSVDTPPKNMVLPVDKMIGLGLTEQAVGKVFLSSDMTSGKRRHILKGWRQIKKAFQLKWTKAQAPFGISSVLISPPFFKFVAGGAFIDLHGNITFSSSESSNEAGLTSHVIALNLMLVFKFRLVEDNVTVKMELIGIHFFDVEGKMDCREMNEILKILYMKHALPISFKIPLPLYEGVMLANAMLSPFQGFATMSSDFEWIRHG